MKKQRGESEKLLKKENNIAFSEFQNINQSILSWYNVNFTISSASKTSKILSNVSGFSNPKEILAIMGPSGSGKTSLLSILSNRLRMESTFSITGDIFINKQPINTDNLKSLIGYVLQENILFDYLTPYEFLYFTLRMKSSDPKEIIEQRVNNLLEELCLTEVKNSLIGDHLKKGLSGGEKKRISIAAELLVCPSVLILDEPTSGLDSSYALVMMKTLKKLASYGTNIILTIHQPNYEIFSMFDRLILMQEGRFVYQGKALESVEYFNRAGFQVSDKINPPEYYMRILKIFNRNDLSEEEKATTNTLTNNYKTLEANNLLDMKIANIDSLPEVYSVGFIKSVRLLIWREILNHKRNFFLIKTRIFRTICFSIITTLSFQNIGYNNSGLESRKSLILLIANDLNGMQNLAMAMSISFEKDIVSKELNENFYGINSYFLSKLLIEIPFIIFSTLVEVLSSYYVAGLNQEYLSKVFLDLFIMFYLQILASSCGIFVGSLAPSPVLAFGLCSFVSGTFMLLGGYFSPTNRQNQYTGWVKYLCYQYFIKNAVLKNEFDDLNIDVDVYPGPNERYDIEGEIFDNILICLIHFLLLYASGYFIYSYKLRQQV